MGWTSSVKWSPQNQEGLIRFIRGVFFHPSVVITCRVGRSSSSCGGHSSWQDCASPRGDAASWDGPVHSGSCPHPDYRSRTPVDWWNLRTFCARFNDPSFSCTLLDDCCVWPRTLATGNSPFWFNFRWIRSPHSNATFWIIKSATELKQYKANDALDWNPIHSNSWHRCFHSNSVEILF